MKPVHCVAIGAAVLLGTIAISSASPPPLLARARSVEAGRAQLMAFGGRSPAQLHGASAKLDAALADLSRHAYRARPGRVLADLHAMSPAARFTQSGTTPMVAVDAVTRGDTQKLAAALVALGLTHPAIFRNDVGGWLPVSAITNAAARTEVLSLRAAMPHTRATVATQGDFAIGTSALRTTYPTLTGAGVTVGVLSDSFDCYAIYASSGVPPSGPNGYASNGFTATANDDEADGALPPNINVLEEAGGTAGVPGSQDCLNYGAPLQLPFTDEGRAIMQIVHAVAPGASVAFYTADNSEADFASGIVALVDAGAKVEADDVGYFDEPFFQDGLVAQAIDTVAAKGVAYFSAAGNESDLAYDNNSPSFTSTKTTLPGGDQENLLIFGTSAGANVTALRVGIPALVPGELLAIVLEWNQPYVTGAPASPGASSQMDLCVEGASSSTTVINLDGETTTCTGPNATGVDPVQVMIIGNSAAATSNTPVQVVNLLIGVSNTTKPTMIKLVVEDGGAGSEIDPTYATNSATLQGHPQAAGAAAVGAAAFYSTPDCGTSPATLEYFSSLGGAPLLFNTSGVAITPPIIRQKPNFVGPDGVNNTFLGFQIPAGTDTSAVAQCANNASYPNFYGTSAATPHAAGAAALMLQANPAVTPSQIYSNLENSAAAMGTVPSPASGVYNFSDGYGFIQAQPAMARLPAGPPVITVVPSTVAMNTSSMLTWLAVNATSCTASGNWSGAEAVSGSMTVTPTVTGTNTYTLACVGPSGTQSASATLNVVNALSALAITTTEFPGGHVGGAYSTSLAATGGAPPYVWLFSGGTLPPGLELNPTTGAITGTPTAAASATSLIFQVSDSETPAQIQLATIAMTIVPALVISTTSLPNGEVGTAYSETLTATGGTTPYVWSVSSGSMPAGLTLASNGTISGTPTTAVSASSLTLQVSDSESPAQTKTASFSMTVSAAPGSGHGGGGGLGGVTLLALAGFVLARLFRAAPALAPRRVRSRERA